MLPGGIVNGLSANLRASHRVRGGYTLVMVVMVLGVVSIFASVLLSMASVSLEQTRLSDRRELTLWAADAAIEEALWRLGHQLAGGPKAEGRIVTRSNDSSVVVTITPVRSGSFRIEAESVYAPQGRDDVRMPARARVAAGVEADSTGRRLHISSWTEGWPEHQ